MQLCANQTVRTGTVPKSDRGGGGGIPLDGSPTDERLHPRDDGMSTRARSK